MNNLSLINMAKNYKHNPKIKPIFASFLDMKIGSYLISENFRIFLKRYSLDELWECCDYIRNFKDNSGVCLLFPGYTGYAEETFEIFLNMTYNKCKKEMDKYIILIKLIMINFLKWRENNGLPKISNEKLSKLKEGLEFLIIEDVDDKETEKYKNMIEDIFKEIKKYNKTNYKNMVLNYLTNMLSKIYMHLTQKVKFFGVEGPIWFLLVVLVILTIMINYNIESLKTLIEILKT